MIVADAFFTTAIVIGVIIAILIALWPARVANRKGHSFILFFLLSIPFFIPMLIIAYLVPRRRR